MTEAVERAQPPALEGQDRTRDAAYLGRLSNNDAVNPSGKLLKPSFLSHRSSLAVKAHLHSSSRSASRVRASKRQTALPGGAALEFSS